MKANIHVEVKCGECSGMMYYNADNHIRCNTLRCKQRGILYEAPSVELKPVLSVTVTKKGKA